jgi:hypothetical protein
MTRFSQEIVEQHIRQHHPGCPEFAVTFFAKEISSRDWKSVSVGKAVGITIQNFLRHEMTDYDTLLLHGMDRGEARRRVQPRVNRMLKVWRKKPKAPRHKTVREDQNV